MVKHQHEIRDPVHVFIRVDAADRRIIDSRPVQRLRQIHQLAMTYLLYPGASHRRFEHALGVMELAGRVFDVVTADANVSGPVRDVIPEINDEREKLYWRAVVRMAALCHDLGHLPFSHAAELELLPRGWSHERLSRELILSEEMRSLWHEVTPPLRPEDIAKLAVGPAKAGDNVSFSNWQAILSEIIVGDAFGVDRMDYLLRDAHHLGVAYGRFDQYRLVDTLRILPAPEGDVNGEPALGVEDGGLQSAEALLLARYFMYSQVYFHHVRQIYDVHLGDFLRDWLTDGAFSTDIETHMRLTDNEVSAAIQAAALDSQALGHMNAKRIGERTHYRLLYQRNPEDLKTNPDASTAVLGAAASEFGPEAVRRRARVDTGGDVWFPVLTRDGRVVSSTSASTVLRQLPPVLVDNVFVAPELLGHARRWLADRRSAVIQPTLPEEE